MISLIINRLGNGARFALAVTKEAGASVLTYELYPLGVFPSTMPLLASPWSKMGGRPPVLFLHGVFHNPATFACIKQRLAWAGWRQFGDINLLNTLKPITANAEAVAEAVEDLCRRYEVPQVDIVAHSMGGIVARYFVQKLGGDGRVRNLITIATPHQGTAVSRYSMFPHLRELAPNSRILNDLNACSAPTVTQGVAILGELDVLMRPRHCAEWPGMRNIRLKGVGHAGLLFSRRVSQILVAHLGHDLKEKTQP